MIQTPNVTNEPDYSEITKRIVQVADPEKIILFGSRARGDNRVDSDIDLLVVVKSIRDRGSLVMQMRRAIGYIGISFDVFAYSRAEVAKRANWFTSPISSALQEGRTLYEKS